ncbi:MAG: hypothetical protein H0V01_01755 [Bacteroidetes bacterium]|nr:hypothetical protein [Bacteroidota bacterium]HET6243267.1 hypothetical protein [Bacteroidia bacterium]
MKKLLILLIPFLLVFFSCNQSQIAEERNETPLETSPELKTEVIKSGEMALHKTFYKNGQLRIQGNMLNGKREGKWVSFYEDGMPWSETWFDKGRKHGSTTTWNSDGKKYYEGHFENNKESGKWTYWDENGSVIKEVEY